MTDAVAVGERAGAGPVFTAVDPATGTPGQTYAGHTAAQAVAIARQATPPSPPGGGPASPSVRP